MGCFRRDQKKFDKMFHSLSSINSLKEDLDAPLTKNIVIHHAWHMSRIPIMIDILFKKDRSIIFAPSVFQWNTWHQMNLIKFKCRLRSKNATAYCKKKQLVAGQYVSFIGLWISDWQKWSTVLIFFLKIIPHTLLKCSLYDTFSHNNVLIKIDSISQFSFSNFWTKLMRCFEVNGTRYIAR